VGRVRGSSRDSEKPGGRAPCQPGNPVATRRAPSPDRNVSASRSQTEKTVPKLVFSSCQSEVWCLRWSAGVMKRRCTIGSSRRGRSKFPCSSRFATPKTTSKTSTPSGGTPSARTAARRTGSARRISPGWKRKRGRHVKARVGVMDLVEAPKERDLVVGAVPQVRHGVEAQDADGDRRP
jgi:hypothetical protein